MHRTRRSIQRLISQTLARWLDNPGEKRVSAGRMERRIRCISTAKRIDVIVRETPWGHACR